MVLTRGLVLGLGMTVTFVAVLAARRTRLATVRLAAVGFGLITAGVVVEGFLYHAGGVDLVTVHTLSSAAIGLGFAALLYSLWRA